MRLSRHVVVFIATTLVLVCFAPFYFPTPRLVVLLKDKGCVNPALLTKLPPLNRILAAAAKIRGPTDLPLPFDCDSLERFGGRADDASLDADGGKWVCGLRRLQSPCTAVSLGSNLDFSFEQAVSQTTPCDIITADCTVDEEKASALLPARAKFFKLCVGAVNSKPTDIRGRPGHVFVTLPRLLELSGHSRIDVLKVWIQLNIYCRVAHARMSICCSKSPVHCAT
jgi:hypothetical protein